MEMTDKIFNMIWSQALASDDQDAFASDIALSSIWGEPDEDEQVKINHQCATIWDVAHMSFRDLLEQEHMGQSALARKFCIPLRTVQHWAAGDRACPQWVILGFARQLGLI